MPRLTMIILALILLASAASAEFLDRAFFDGIDPETFDDYAGWAWDERDHDFGPYNIAGEYDMDAYQMPIAEPVVVPAIGSSSISITLHPPVSAMGFDLGAANFGDTEITFYGAEGEVLVTVLMSDLYDDGSGPAGYQGFVGFRDDEEREIHEVTIGPWVDFYLDNIYVGGGTVNTEAANLSGIKALYR